MPSAPEPQPIRLFEPCFTSEPGREGAEYTLCPASDSDATGQAGDPAGAWSSDALALGILLPAGDESSGGRDAITSHAFQRERCQTEQAPQRAAVLSKRTAQRAGRTPPAKRLLQYLP